MHLIAHTWGSRSAVTSAVAALLLANPPRTGGSQSGGSPPDPEPGGPSTVAALATACERMPRAVICLQSSAYLHGLLDEAPTRLWLALPQGHGVAKPTDPSWRIIRWSDARAFKTGVVADDRFGALIRRTDAARTVVDLLRYSRYLRGLRPGIRAARLYVAGGGAAADLIAVAKQLRVSTATMRDIEILADALGEDLS